MPIYYFESERGCGIRQFARDKSALPSLRRELGTSTAIFKLGRATTEQLKWVKAFGGFIPDTRSTRRLLAGEASHA